MASFFKKIFSLTLLFGICIAASNAAWPVKREADANTQARRSMRIAAKRNRTQESAASTTECTETILDPFSTDALAISSQVFKCPTSCSFNLNGKKLKKLGKASEGACSYEFEFTQHNNNEATSICLNLDFCPPLDKKIKRIKQVYPREVEYPGNIKLKATEPFHGLNMIDGGLVIVRQNLGMSYKLLSDNLEPLSSYFLEKYSINLESFSLTICCKKEVPLYGTEFWFFNRKKEEYRKGNYTADLTSLESFRDAPREFTALSLRCQNIENFRKKFTQENNLPQSNP